MSVLSLLTPQKLTVTAILLICLNVSALAQQGEQTLPAQEAEQTLPAQQADKPTKQANDTTLEIAPDSTLDTAINTDAKATQSTRVKALLPVPLTQQHKDDLAHYLPANKIKPLLAGPDDYITLITDNLSVNTKGVAILVPDWQQGATNPKAINFLRNTLPQDGWTTISIQPMNKPQHYPSTALTLTEQQEENKAIIDSYQVTFGAMLNAVLDKSNEYPGVVMIIAQGHHGAMVLDILAGNNEQVSITKQPNAVVLLSSYVLTNHLLLDESNTAFAHTLALSEYPVLDLLLRFDNPVVLNKAKQRLALSKKEMKVYYRQRQLNNTSVGYYPEQELRKQINGWLKAIGL